MLTFAMFVAVLRESRVWARLTGKMDVVDKSDCISVVCRLNTFCSLFELTLETLNIL